MTLTIGRATGIIEMDRSQSGDTLSVIGVTPVGAYNDLLALQQQLTGLVGNQDDPVVPFISTDDSSVNGFYRPLSVDAGYVGSQADGAFSFAVSLQRVRGYSNGLCEVTTQEVVRTNAHSFTVPPGIVATSSGTPDLRPTIVPAATIVRGVEFPIGSTTNIGINTYTQAAPLALTTYRDDVPPANYYRGACLVEILYGSTWYPVVGRNMKAATQWRISNGMIRLGYNQSLAAFAIEVWNNAGATGAWEAIGISHVTNGSIGPVIGLGGFLSILRNSPECVVVRVGIDPDFTYRIMRGNFYVEASWTSGTATKYGAGFTATAASSAVSTWGIQKTTNDANGNRGVFGMPVAIATDLVNGRINANVAATSGSMFMGMVLDGTSGISGNLAADLANQFFGLTNWSQKVIPR